MLSTSLRGRTVFPLLAGTSVRYFIQGAPKNTMNLNDRSGLKKFLRNADGTINRSPDDPYQESYKEKNEKIRQYYTTAEPNKPVPLAENSFEPGKYGMRRRIHIAKNKKLDMWVGNEFAEGTNAFRK